MFFDFGAKFETLLFALSEFAPVFALAAVVVIITKLVLFSRRKVGSVGWAQLGFYAISGVLIGYIENISGNKLGGLLPSAIITIAFAISMYQRINNSNAVPAGGQSPIYISAAISTSTFLISARYFNLLFN